MAQRRIPPRPDRSCRKGARQEREDRALCYLARGPAWALWCAGWGRNALLTQRGASFAATPLGRLKLPPASNQPDNMTGNKKKLGQRRALKQRRERPRRKPAG